MIYCLISADIPFTQSYQSSQRSLRVVLNYERSMNKGFLITYKKIISTTDLCVSLMQDHFHMIFTLTASSDP